jgi:hypothetical protein
MPADSAKNFIEVVHSAAAGPGWTIGNIVPVNTIQGSPDSWEFAATHEDGTFMTVYVNAFTSTVNPRSIALSAMQQEELQRLSEQPPETLTPEQVGEVNKYLAGLEGNPGVG